MLPVRSQRAGSILSRGFDKEESVTQERVLHRNKVIIVCGLMGAGKTVLSRELAQNLNALWLSEADEKDNRNPYLSDYYSEPCRWGFTMQIHMLGERFCQHQHAQWHALNGYGSAVLDSSYWQDTAFARLQRKLGCISEREYNTYTSIYQSMTAQILLPNVCIRVRVSPEVCRNRIGLRMQNETGRKCEKTVDLDYLRALDLEIDQMTDVLHAQGVLVIDVPWDENRSLPKDRHSVVENLTSRITELEPIDPFLDLHRRTS
jgi:deoxyadenosine/deoxycytidine kinase